MQYLVRDSATGAHIVKETNIPAPTAEVGDVVGYLSPDSKDPYDYFEGTVSHIQITQSQDSTAVVYTLKDGTVIEDSDIEYSYAP